MGVGPRRRIDNWEDDEKNIAVRVGQWSEAVVLFLSGCIPESEVDHFAVNFHSCSIVIKDGGHVFGGKFVLRVAGLGKSDLMRMQVLPTAPSPTTTNFIEVAYSLIDLIILHAEIADTDW